jgi:predicted SAM-dependent methyltransferase
MPGAALRINLGGTERRDGWTIINPVPGPHVDIAGDHGKLADFADDSVEEIYASHVLEHIPLFLETLMHMRRVLVPGGRLRVAVPDLMALARLYLRPDLGPQDRWIVMRMIYGGHVDAFDEHHHGFDEVTLHAYLTGAGFRDVKRVADFGLFADTSVYTHKGVAISLNMEARK